MEFSIFELGDMQKVRSLNIPKFGTPPPCSPLFVSELNSSMKSTISHDFPSPDLLKGQKDEKIKENAKFFSF